jgi:7,8-dihydroneopterin aldolase/epimerase/oxygenase
VVGVVVEKQSKMAYIELEEMEFHAFHGCFKEERVVGNKFIVAFSFEFYSKNAELSDNIDDTINYQKVYDLVKDEMSITSHLLENLAHRILEKIMINFPTIVNSKVKVSKINPTLGGKMKAVSLTLERKKQNF